MTSQTQDNQAQTTEQKISDKELNFRALEQKYKSQVELERQARVELERKVQELEQRKPALQEEDDDDSDPYVNKRKLNTTLNRFSENFDKKTHQSMQQIKEQAKEELKQEMWLDQNPDFYDVLQNNADKLAQHAPELAKTILKMPEGFERQKLVYQNIKTLNLHKPPEKQSSIQDKIDANRRSPYYQPSHVGTAPYSSQGDFSANGQKQAYDKLLQLKNNLRL